MLSPEIADDWYAHVVYTYPWGVEGTQLAQHDGPRKWQKAALDRLTEVQLENQYRMEMGLEPRQYKHATVSGRDTGKSALVSWEIHKMMSCHIGSTTIVTANTESQLKSRTWAELGKWHTLAINSHWFDRTALSYVPQKWFGNMVKEQLGIDTGYYYAQAQLWNEDQPDSFAGVHNPLGLTVIFDEASGIPKPIWPVTAGFFFDKALHRYWLVYSNGRQNTGEFFECFHLNRDYWERTHLDSRTVEGVDQRALQEIIDQHGIDSDVARVEVLGQFPGASSNQVIPRNLVREAMARELPDVDDSSPLIMGVDVSTSARGKAVIRFRRGRDARSIPPMKFTGETSLKDMQLAYKVAEAIDKYKPDAVCVDAGHGHGVIDRLRELKYTIHAIDFSGASSRRDCHNKRASMWFDLCDWLYTGCIDKDLDLETDLVNLRYGFTGADGDRKLLESKRHLERRGLSSPDDGDALALTLAVKVAARNINSQYTNRRRTLSDTDYDVLSMGW